MRSVRRAVQKIVASAIGLPLLVLGVVLIPLPGPGLLLCFLALLVLSFGFDWAKAYRDKAWHILKEIFETSRRRVDNEDITRKKRNKK